MTIISVEKQFWTIVHRN